MKEGITSWKEESRNGQWDYRCASFIYTKLTKLSQYSSTLKESRYALAGSCSKKQWTGMYSQIKFHLPNSLNYKLFVILPTSTHQAHSNW